MVKIKKLGIWRSVNNGKGIRKNVCKIKQIDRYGKFTLC